MSYEPTVFVVDDDQAIRSTLHFVISSAGFNVELHANANEFLAACDPEKAGCLLVDVRMPEMSGLDLQRELQVRDIRLPVIVLSGHGDVPMASRALKQGAFDFLEKPFDNEVLLDRIRQAFVLDLETRRRHILHRQIGERLAQLSPDEREVLEAVLAGESNKSMAVRLDVALTTIEKRRKRIKEKMHARNLPDLIRMIAFLRDESA